MKQVVCVPCRLFYKPKKIGIAIEEGMPRGDGSTWTPYKLWQGDLWECSGCGSQVVRGFGHEPIAEHYQATYAREVERWRPMFRVDDC